MKNLFEYIQESEKEYKWRVKFAVMVTPEMLDKVERLLAKFDVKSVGSVKKTILQGRALDFAELGPTEVYTTDVVCSLPCTREQVREVLSLGLQIPNSMVVVRSEHEPLETDREPKEPMDKDKPLLGTDYPRSADSKDVYGTEYNKKLVKDSKSKFKFEVAGKEQTTASGPDYGEKKSNSPLANKLSPLKKLPKKI